METRFLVTDVTRMSSASVCVAGYVQEGDGYRSVRPVLADDTIPEDWLYSTKTPIRPFSIITLNFLRPILKPPHIEDELFEQELVENHQRHAPEYRLSFLQKTATGSVDELFSNCHVFRPGEGYWVPVGSNCRSIGTIAASNVSVYLDLRPGDPPTWKYTLKFDDAAGANFRLPLTDLAARRFLQHLCREVGLTPDEAGRKMGRVLRAADHCLVRVGLARPRRPFPDRCALLVTAIHSFPDYLDGRCHAEFPRDYA